MPFWCLFLDPHQTTHYSNIGVWSRKATELGPHTSGAFEQCKAIRLTTWPKIQWFLHWFPTLKPGQCFTYTGFHGWPCRLKSFNPFDEIFQGKEDMSQPMSLNSAHSLCNIIQVQILCIIFAQPATSSSLTINIFLQMRPTLASSLFLRVTSLYVCISQCADDAKTWQGSNKRKSHGFFVLKKKLKKSLHSFLFLRGGCHNQFDDDSL